MRRKILLFISAITLSCQVFAQSQQEMIEKARATGIPESQIQEMLQKQSSKPNPSNNKVSDSGAVNDRNNQLQQDSLFMLSAEDQQLLNKKEEDPKNTVFGSEIFKTKDLTFSPNLNIPTPKNYVLSAGDEVKINIWGNSELNLAQTITPEGRIFIQDIGPIALSGLTIEQAESKVKNEMSKAYNGLLDGSNSLSLTLNKIRSIKVNVAGEALVPGTYILPSFSSLLNALYMAGGVNNIGSLRSIKVYRDNKLKAELDVYDYLINGKSNENIRLEDGDMVIVEPYKSLIYTQGGLKRERIFELKEGETLQDLINIAGGFKGDAYKENVEVERKNGSSYSISTVSKDDFANFVMFDGDSLKIKDIVLRYHNKLTLTGAVWYPGTYELSSKVGTVKQLVEKAEGLKGDEFAGRAQIIRVNPDFTKSVIAVDIKGIMNGTASDVELKADDELFIPAISELREDYTISVSGAVNQGSDTIHYKHNMTVEDAIIMAGGLTESAATIKVDVSRRVKDPKSDKDLDQIVEVFEVNLTDGLAVDNNGNLLTLEPFDEIYVRHSPGYREQETVTINGQVLFRGDYVLKGVNNRLSDIVNDAGGVTHEAYIKGASLVRILTEDEKKRVETLMDLSKNTESKDSIVVSNIDINNYTVGIDLEAALANPGSESDIVLREGDILTIPKKQSTVKVSGAIIYPNSTTYIAGMNAKDYIEQAGGYSDYAKKRPIVIYMNGKVAVTKQRFFAKRYPKIEPGCEILVTNKRAREKMAMAQIMSIATSTTSMAAMVASMMSTLSK